MEVQAEIDADSNCLAAGNSAQVAEFADNGFAGSVHSEVVVEMQHSNAENSEMNELLDGSGNNVDSADVEMMADQSDFVLAADKMVSVSEEVCQHLLLPAAIHFDCGLRDIDFNVGVIAMIAAVTLFPLADASHSSSAGHPRFRHPSTLLGFFRAVALPPTISFLWVSVSEEVCQHLLLPAVIHFDCGLRIFSQDLPSDVVVQVGKVDFQLHKFMLVAKSGLIRRKVIESKRADLGRRIDLSEVPGGAAAFEKAAMFCYGVSFEISVNSVAAVRCAAEYLQMTEDYCRGNLVQRTEEFINQIALKTLPGAVALLRSCDDAPDLLRPVEHVRIVQRSVDVISLKACNEANFPTRSPADWWAAELALLFPTSFKKILTGMTSRRAAPKSLAVAIVTYAEKSLPNLLLSEGAARPFVTGSDAARARQRCLLDSLVSILPPDRDAPLPVGFVYRLLRAAVFLGASEACRRELERRASASLDQAAVANLLTISLDYSGERVVDLDSARRIVASFAEREASAAAGGGVLYGSGFKGVCSSPAVQKAARTVDSFLGEIATDKELSVSKFTGIAGALPKSARRFDDDLYRAVDIYLKVQIPNSMAFKSTIYVPQ
ncbi:hypothetical protein ZIOFF_052329 [Zingiber officinale]|uniref:Phototropic-responsive NPH3 family protein n=1 Tax=Zingiber officinale TaxID=94328 RepID=A0A8J5KTW9_ZINOF|nr:hypothetical protein ZIOFF_052329 [Zingiber officinale]